MFTVIICDQHIIDDCYDKYNIYFKPFLANSEFAFCPWNVSGTSLDEAIPDLKNLIQSKKEWRVVIVNDNFTWNFESVDKRNPFDYVNSSIKKQNFSFEKTSSIKNYRTEQEEMIELALSNPLTKLSIWLCGSPMLSRPNLCYEKFSDEINDIDNDINYFDALSKLNFTPEEVEIDRIRNLRYSKITEQFEIGGELFNPPLSVYAISIRTKDVNDEMAKLSWTEHTEFDYSSFYIENLYSDKLRYLIFDIPYLKKQRDESAYFNFLAFLLIFSSNDCPNGVVRANRVYKTHVEIDDECVVKLVNIYNSKLFSTISHIDDTLKKLREKRSTEVENEVAEICFEADVSIPIELGAHEDRNNLMAKYDKIGLSKDCPIDEFDYWNDQYYSIKKSFLRFLREPRRVIKKAAKEDFHKSNRINDERALQLNEFQREDVLYNLQEEERRMVSTVTTNIYNTNEYTQKMEEANKEIKKRINQRMSKKLTVSVGLIAVAAYFFGFISLIISNINTIKSVVFSFVIALICIGIFTIVGFAFLFILKHRLINRFMHFNFVMSGILKNIEKSVDSFAQYLSHACNVMREFSVLNFSNHDLKVRDNTYLNHKRIIEEKIKKVNEVFAPYISDYQFDYMDVEPYDFDFSVKEDYNFDLPIEISNSDIEFLQAGISVSTPVPYVKSVMISREELYD